MKQTLGWIWPVLLHLAAMIAGTGVSAFLAVIWQGHIAAYPLSLTIFLLVGMVMGLPAYLMIRASGRSNWKSAAIAGFTIGALFPAMMIGFGGGANDQASVGDVPTMINGSYTVAGWINNIALISVIGLLGVIAALTFWFSLRATHDVAAAWGGDDIVPNHPSPWRGGVMIVVAAAFVAAAFAVPEITRDRTCHNVLRNGQVSMAATASFTLKVGSEDWMEVENIVRRFAQARGWSLLSDVRPNDSFQWFQMSLCTEPGTEISVNGMAGLREVYIMVTQPQGGKGWQEPMAALLQLITARWPDAIEFTAQNGEKITPPRWTKLEKPALIPDRPAAQ